MQDKRKQLEVEIPKQQIESIQDETHLVSINLYTAFCNVYVIVSSFVY